MKSATSVASILKATFGGEVVTALEAVDNAPEEVEHTRQQSLYRWDVWGTPSDMVTVVVARGTVAVVLRRRGWLRLVSGCVDGRRVLGTDRTFVLRNS